MTFVYTTNLSEVRVLAETQARAAGLAADRVMDFVIAVSEVAANTVQHAQSPGSMEIWCTAGEIICEIRDSGVITDPMTVGRQPPAADASGGHGLWLVHQICDKVDLRSDESGTTIRLHMSLAPPLPLPPTLPPTLPPAGGGKRDSPDPNGTRQHPM
jgi:anti-sigma regulatory factor (Ser/Thr protein kinase)